MQFYVYNENFSELLQTVDAENIEEAETILKEDNFEWKLTWHNGDDAWRKYRVEFWVEEWNCYMGYFYIILTINKQ